MRHLGLCATAALCTLAFSGLQAQVLKNNSRPEVIFINRGGIEIDSMVTSEVIETYYSTIERGFRQTGLPRFIIAGKNQKMIFGIGGNADMRLSYDFDGIAAGNHTGVNAILWYNGGNSYLQFSQLVNGDVNDLMSNQSGRVDVRSYLRDKGAFPSDGKLEISYVTISVATWKAGSSTVFHTFRFGAV